MRVSLRSLGEKIRAFFPRAGLAMRLVLKRILERKIERWVAAYVAGAWVVTEIVEFVVREFGGPEVIVRVLVVVLGYGLVGTVVIAWYHGEKGAQKVPPLERWILSVLALAAVVSSIAVVAADDRNGGVTESNGSPPPTILSFGSSVDESQSDRLGTRRESLRAFVEGRRLIGRIELDSAEARLREAIDVDSSFAHAHHLLAVTLYWQGVRDANLRATLAPEIRRSSARAARRVGSASATDSMHVVAFHAFQTGDYERARRLYNELIRPDSADAYAWLLLGSVEVEDPWLERTATGDFTPRTDLNVATRAFNRAALQWPDFFLGYGHLFEIYGWLARSLLLGECSAFHPPGADPILPWEKPGASQRVPFCPVAGDSIRWVPFDRHGEIDRATAERWAERYLRETLRHVERWVGYAPDDPQPKRVYLEWLVTQRQFVRDALGGRFRDSLTHRAHELLTEILAAERDTTPEDRVRLGVLELAIGDYQSAVAQTSQALERYREVDGEVPSAALNVLVATGQLTDAMWLAGEVWKRSGVAAPSADGVGYIPFGEAARPIVGEIQVLGTLGVGGDLLEDSFERLARSWSEPAYGLEDQLALRRTALGYLGAALLVDRRLAARWFEGWGSVPPAWSAMLTLDDDPAWARTLVRDAVRGLDPVTSRRSEFYVLARLAQLTSQDSLAFALFDQLEARPLRLTEFDDGWGLVTRSYLDRARLHAGRGDPELAVGFYDRFISAWTHAEGSAEPRLEEALAERERLDVP